MAVSDLPDAWSDDAGLSSHLDESIASFVCDPCQEEGHSYEAKGYCMDCTHYLCETCFKHHCTPKPTRYHKLLDKEQMAQTKPDKVLKDECTDKCSVHGDEILKYFCEDHKVFGCTVCVTLEHRTCKVVYIPTLAADLFNAKEYKLFKLTLESMIRNSNTIQVRGTQKLEDAKGQVDMELVKIRAFRKEIDGFFDKLENNLSSKLTQLRDENQDVLVKVIKKNAIIGNKLKEIEKEMKDKEAKLQKCRLFVDMKQRTETIQNFEKDINTMTKDFKVKEITFIQSVSLTNVIRGKSETFGSLVSYHESYPLNISDIVVEDIAVLPRERIAILCQKVKQNPNYCILCIVTKHTPSKVVTTMKMPACTRGLARVGENEIAISQKGQICIYSATDKIVLDKIIQIPAGLNDPIASVNDVFIGRTRTSPYMLRVVNIDGEIVTTFPIKIGKECNSPCYIAVNSDHTAMFVSDGVKKSLICLNMEGEVKREYKPGSDWDPRCVAVSSDGLVCVSDSKNDKIHILTHDLEPQYVISCTRYGILGPRGLAVCDRKRKLFVASPRGKTISTFNI